MDYEVGDIVKLKKQHPCGSKEWRILRVGADCHLGNTGAIIGKTGWDGVQIRMRFLEG